MVTGNGTVPGAHAQISPGPPNGPESKNDITEQCFNTRPSSAGLRLVEHANLHDDAGAKFTKQANLDQPPLVGDRNAFAETENTTVVYYRGIPIVIGLTFDTGFRIKAFPQVPITPLAAITKHTGARLEEARVAEAQARATTVVLLLSVAGAALPLLIAVWWIAKQFSDTVVETVGQRASVIFNIVAASILVAPLVLGVIEGHIDPFVSVEVTTGVSILYGSSHGSLSEDTGNALAGAPFVVTAWMSVRRLGNGFVAALTLSLLAIAFLAFYLVRLELKKGEQLMAASAKGGAGFSLLKLFPTLRLRLGSKGIDGEKIFRFCIKFKPNELDDGGIPIIEGRKQEIPLLATQYFRTRANKYNLYAKDQDIDNAVREDARVVAMQEFRKKRGTQFELNCYVRLNKQTMYDAIMTKTAIWSKHMPRGWEYIRKDGRWSCESLEWYRLHATYPPPVTLAILRLGLIDYMDYVQSIAEIEENRKAWSDFDEDGVKTTLVIRKDANAERLAEEEDKNASIDFVKTEEAPSRLQHSPSVATTLEICWPGGSLANRRGSFNGGRVHINYIIDYDTNGSDSLL